MFHKLLHSQAVERALGRESADLSSRPGFVTNELSDLCKVSVPVSSSLQCRGRGRGGAQAVPEPAGRVGPVWMESLLCHLLSAQSRGSSRSQPGHLPWACEALSEALQLLWRGGQRSPLRERSQDLPVSPQPFLSSQPPPQPPESRPPHLLCQLPHQPPRPTAAKLVFMGV